MGERGRGRETMRERERERELKPKRSTERERTERERERERERREREREREREGDRERERWRENPLHSEIENILGACCRPMSPSEQRNLDLMRKETNEHDGRLFGHPLGLASVDLS